MIDESGVNHVWKFLFKKRKIEDDVIVAAVVTQTSALINDLHHQIDLRFKELSAQVKEIELGLVQMETKLLTKDLKDKQALWSSSLQTT